MNKTYLTIALGILAVSGLIVLSVRQSALTEPSEQFTVVTSFYPLYFFAQTIGGEKIRVVNMTPAGVEPHEYEPTPQDIATIERSKLLVLNGGNLEVWSDDIRKHIDPTKTAILIAGENLTTQTVVQDGKKLTDPHVWLSPQFAKQQVEKILAGIAGIDPENKNYYEQHAAALLRELGALDQEYRTGLELCTRKDFVTSHTAFGYIAETYGLTQVPIAGLSPDVEPSAQELAAIVQFVRAQDIRAIFFESLVSPRLAQTIANETGATTMILDPLEGLTDSDVAAGKNYFTVMRDNLTNLRIALECR